MVLDSGIIISNLILRKISLSLDWCVKNIFSDSDDANLGRCIFHSTGIPCSTDIKNLKVSSYYFKVNDEINIEKLSDDDDDDFNNALSFWPMPSPAVMLLFHIYFTKVCYDHFQNVFSFQIKLLLLKKKTNFSERNI